MVNKILAAFVAADGLFAVTGGLMLGFAIIVQQTCFDPPSEGENAARDLLYRDFPFTAGIVNAVFVLVAFVLTIPALVTDNRSILKVSGYVVAFCAVFTMGIGLDLWVLTLTMRSEYEKIWTSQPSDIQSMMQISFQCCGFQNSTSPAFVTDQICPSPASAALVQGCASPLTSFGNEFVDNIFTGVFGMVGVDVVLIITIACLLKDRKERARFRYIDEKSRTF